MSQERREPWPADEVGTADRAYRDGLLALNEAGVEFLVGGSFALAWYTGVGRWTKDLDIILREGDLSRALHVLSEAGFGTEVPFAHWLAKAHRDGVFLDVIFSSGNGITAVDDEWFAHGRWHECFGVPVRLCPPEEMLWSKAFIMERERFDGADVAHLLRTQGPLLDWDRLESRFGPWWRVLLAHLVLFEFTYPGERERVPRYVVERLLRRRQEEQAPSSPDRVCFGTLLSREQYLQDVEQWGYRDARVVLGLMSRPEVRAWTEAIAEDHPSQDPERRTHSSGTAQDRSS